jgi:hypothetical protein
VSNNDNGRLTRGWSHGFERMPDHRLSKNGMKNLGQLGLHASTLPSGEEDGGNFHERLLK